MGCFIDADDEDDDDAARLALLEAARLSEVRVEMSPEAAAAIAATRCSKHERARARMIRAEALLVHVVEVAICDFACADWLYFDR